MMGFFHLQDYYDGVFLNFDIFSHIQGLTWYAKRLRVDEDGDVAEQFLDEVLPEIPASTTDHHKAFPRFQINNRNRPAKVEKQVILQEGKLQQCIEHQGRLLLVWRGKKTWENWSLHAFVSKVRYFKFICTWWSSYEDDLCRFWWRESFAYSTEACINFIKESTLEA